MEKTSNIAEKTAQGAEKAAESMADTFLKVMDKLAGKRSDLKLSFQELTLDLGMAKATLNGSVVLDIVFAKEEETTSSTSRAELTM